MFSFFSKKNNNSGCNGSHNHSDCTKVMENLYLIIDGEATKSDEQHFMEHVEKCAPCLEKYNVEHKIVQLVKDKIEKKCCPESVITSIKEQINKESLS